MFVNHIIQSLLLGDSPFNNAGTGPARASNARPGQEEVQLHLLYREQHQPGGKQTQWIHRTASKTLLKFETLKILNTFLE